ncbi:MAG TPA: putative lipid II flippase FtsW [Candidatus Baltobacteraceae bacterium]|nr:putative lipid II flippase FtsW [Candidatus Baltobacteraceae bacterium]
MRAALSAKRPAPPSRAEASRPFVAAPPDTLLFGAVASLFAIGLVMIFSASSAQAYADHHDTAYYVKHQLIYLVAGLGLAYVAYRIDYRKLKALAPYALVLCILSLLAVLVPHVGVVVNGARRWIGAGMISLQPSEFAKLGLVLYLAAALAARGDKITSLSKGLFPLCVPVITIAVAILMEPDMGTASLIVFTAFAMFFAAGARIEHLLLILFVTVPPVILTILTSPYKRARIFAFIDPWRDPQNTGFHIVQSLLALGSGGFMGVGLGESRAKFFYLPEQYTDFIFSVLGEELGLVGTVGVIVLFIVFVYRGIRIAIAAPDRFGFFLAAGCTAMIAIQAFVNIGVVTSSWPVTGVPLPFISFGGSSLIVSLVAVALVINVGRYRKINLP